MEAGGRLGVVVGAPAGLVGAELDGVRPVVRGRQR